MVQSMVRVHDPGDVVRGSSIIPGPGGHCFEILSVHGIREIHDRHHDPGQAHSTEELVGVCPEWRIQR